MAAAELGHPACAKIIFPSPKLSHPLVQHGPQNLSGHDEAGAGGLDLDIACQDAHLPPKIKFLVKHYILLPRSQQQLVRRHLLMNMTLFNSLSHAVTLIGHSGFKRGYLVLLQAVSPPLQSHCGGAKIG